MTKLNISLSETVIELDSKDGFSVELRGYAAGQLKEIWVLAKTNIRLGKYLTDLSLWASVKLQNPHGVSPLDILVDQENGVYCTTFGTATIFFFVVHRRIVVDWLSGLLRPLTDFEPRGDRPSVH